MTLYSTENSQALGTGKLSGEGSVVDRELADLFINYKKTVASRYMAATADEIEVLISRKEYHVSKKVDGQMWFAVLDGEEAFFASPKGKVISGDHPLVNELKTLSKAATGRKVVAGELYAEGKRERSRCGDIASALGGGAVADVDRMRFCAFDLCTTSDSPAPEDEADPFAYAPKLAELQGLFAKGKLVQCVATELVSGAAAVRKLYTEWVDSGEQEGLVVRSSKATPFKFKPSITIDAVIIGYTIRREDAEQCSSILLGLMRPDGQIQELGSCGNLGEASFRKELLLKLTPLSVESEYRRASSSGALYRFIEPSIVVEIKSTDIQSDNSSGDPIRRMALQYSADKGWQRLRKMPVASMLHPVFVRFRDDKSFCENDIRMSQLDAHVYVRDSKESATVIELSPSTILRREVYTKTSKGSLMVRKLVVWKSNKNEEDSAYAPYVVHFTDYSANRKDPLKREVRLAGTEEKAIAIADAILTKNIKKGWAQV